MSKRALLSIVCCLAAVAGCSGSEKAPSTPASGGTAPAAPSAAASVNPTGRVIVVELYSDEKGNYFKPAKLEAHRGDLVRFTLKSGVHNIHFLPDSNPGAQGLPAASEFLQLPDQTWDYVVSLPHGKYYFQCDPHALLGMKGWLEVEE